MSPEPLEFESPNIERRREILYGTPGITIYRNGRPVLWIPENFGSLTNNLPDRELKALHEELKAYLGLNRPDDKGC